MSGGYRLQRAVMEACATAEVPHRSAHIALVLAVHADRAGVVEGLGQRTLARLALTTVVTVRAHLGILAAAGVVELDERPNGFPMRYRLTAGLSTTELPQGYHGLDWHHRATTARPLDSRGTARPQGSRETRTFGSEQSARAHGLSPGPDAPHPSPCWCDGCVRYVEGLADHGRDEGEYPLSHERPRAPSLR